MMRRCGSNKLTEQEAESAWAKTSEKQVPVCPVSCSPHHEAARITNCKVRVTSVTEAPGINCFNASQV